jgi:hypothetical protein
MPAKKPAPAPTLEDVLKIFDEVVAEEERKPRELSKKQQELELARCKSDAVYFVNKYCQIYDNDTQGWIPFKLWSFQEEALQAACEYDEQAQRLTFTRIVALKTRQIGFTWLLADAHKLWKVLFRPITEVLVFSQSDEDAMAVLSEQRFKGMYKLLPEWMKQPVTSDSAHEFRLGNGSGIRALPAARGGDSRTVTDVVIDEADLIDDLDGLLSRSEPTLGNKGQMIVIGRAVKDKPNSPFKRLYLTAKANMLEKLPDARWNKAIFVPWFAHPNRTPAWKAQIDRDAMARTFTLDNVHEMYPATDLEALAARTLDKRYAPELIVALTRERTPIQPVGAPTLPGLRIYFPCIDGRTYTIGGDPAGGKSDGDDAAACVLDSETLQQMAVIQVKLEPTQFGNYTADVSLYYNRAMVLAELNNHGIEYIKTLKERGIPLHMGETRRGEKERHAGWYTTERSKNTLYDNGAKAFEEIIEETRGMDNQLHPELATPVIFDYVTASQLASIDKNELKAPPGEHDDMATAWLLAAMGAYRGSSSMVQAKHDLWDVPDIMAAMPIQTGRKNKNGLWQTIAPSPEGLARLKARGIVK